MLRDNGVHNLKNTNEKKRLSFVIMCSIPSVERLIVNSLEQSGFVHSTTATTILIIDAPQGFALKQLQCTNQPHSHIIVTTSNQCPEYWEDLWDLQPDVLLVGEMLRGELEDAIQRVNNNEQYRVTPGRTTNLTTTERRMLHYLARGWTTDRIAAYRGVSTKTVHNTLATVCEKLSVPTRRAAMLYYWGRQDLLD